MSAQCRVQHTTVSSPASGVSKSGEEFRESSPHTRPFLRGGTVQRSRCGRQHLENTTRSNRTQVKDSHSSLAGQGPVASRAVTDAKRNRSRWQWTLRNSAVFAPTEDPPDLLELESWCAALGESPRNSAPPVGRFGRILAPRS
jgi:hypothetical protein